MMHSKDAIATLTKLFFCALLRQDAAQYQIVSCDLSCIVFLAFSSLLFPFRFLSLIFPSTPFLSSHLTSIHPIPSLPLSLPLPRWYLKGKPGGPHPYIPTSLPIATSLHPAHSTSCTYISPSPTRVETDCWVEIMSMGRECYYGALFRAKVIITVINR
jgi:hypothetical protein